MITFEQLNGEDFHLLADIYEGYTPDPKFSIAILAKNGEEVIGRVFLLSPVHVEGPWVKEDYRGGFVGKGLIDSAEQAAKDKGITKVFAYAVSDEIAGYLTRLGYTKEPWMVFTKEI